MQLNRTPALRTALTAASCALLGVSSATANELERWDIDTAVLYYAEDGRVSALEPVISATRNFNSETTLNLKLTYDTLTGASANGATPSNEVQTFTRPSGKGSYVTQPGATPLDDTFRDSRVAVSAQWTAPLGRDYSYSVGAYGSGEHDYFSLGANASLSRYLFNKNTTLSAGLSLAQDRIEPEGEIPVGLSRMAIVGEADFDTVFAASRGDAADDKTIADLLLGVTQVINRRTLMQFNYSISQADGYLTDPYKIVSVIDAQTGANAHVDGDPNQPLLYLYEQRPDSRLKQSFYWQTKYHLTRDIVDLSYRFMWDDWGITSHTFDLKYRWQLGRHYLEPHLRYYQQSAADFYARFLSSDQLAALPAEVSADYRLGELDTTTLGLKYGLQLGNGHEASIRLEYYLQQSDGEAGFGALREQELYPDVEAYMVQLQYSF